MCIYSSFFKQDEKKFQSMIIRVGNKTGQRHHYLLSLRFFWLRLNEKGQVCHKSTFKTGN